MSVRLQICVLQCNTKFDLNGEPVCCNPKPLLSPVILGPHSGVLGFKTSELHVVNRDTSFTNINDIGKSMQSCIHMHACIRIHVHMYIILLSLLLYVFHPLLSLLPPSPSPIYLLSPPILLLSSSFPTSPSLTSSSLYLFLPLFSYFFIPLCYYFPHPLLLLSPPLLLLPPPLLLLRPPLLLLPPPLLLLPPPLLLPPHLLLLPPPLLLPPHLLLLPPPLLLLPPPLLLFLLFLLFSLHTPLLTLFSLFPTSSTHFLATSLLSRLSLPSSTSPFCPSPFLLPLLLPHMPSPVYKHSPCRQAGW